MGNSMKRHILGDMFLGINPQAGPRRTQTSLVATHERLRQANEVMRSALEIACLRLGQK